MVVHKIRVTAMIMLLLSVICGVKSVTVLATPHLGGQVERACSVRSSERTPLTGAEENALAESCKIIRSEMHSLRESQINAFFWLATVAAALFAWGVALLLWSKSVARAAP
jgi:hypothetical protein